METREHVEDVGAALPDLVTMQEYQERAQRFFPSVESLRWYLRQQRQALLPGGRSSAFAYCAPS
jgi:hypothetical protein